MASVYPYSPVPPFMDLTAQEIIFALRAMCPGSGSPDPGSILVIGDSLINNIYEPYSACGYSVLRFAVNGMRAHDIVPWIDRIMDAARPQVVVLALGKNDMGSPGGLDSGLGQRWYFEQDYWAIVQYIIARASSNGRPLKPVLMTVLPTERCAPPPWNNPELLDWYNAYIKAVGVAFGCEVVDFAATYPGIAPIVTDGPYLPPGFTWAGDGIYVHPVGRSNPLMWAYVQLAIEKGLAQAGLPTCATPPVLP